MGEMVNSVRDVLDHFNLQVKMIQLVCRANYGETISNDSIQPLHNTPIIKDRCATHTYLAILYKGKQCYELCTASYFA